MWGTCQPATYVNSWGSGKGIVSYDQGDFAYLPENSNPLLLTGWGVTWRLLMTPLSRNEGLSSGTHTTGTIRYDAYRSSPLGPSACL